MPGETLEQAGGARAPGAPQLPLPLLRLNRGARPSQACAEDDSTLQHIAALALLVPTHPTPAPHHCPPRSSGSEEIQVPSLSTRQRKLLPAAPASPEPSS